MKLLKGDCRDRLRELESSSIDAAVTDPPYGLSKEPDIAEVLTHWLAGDDYQHGSGGFMGKGWDSFVPGPTYWREVFRVMKPGAHLVAFGGTRTYDLLVIAIRMAGFEIRDQLAWLHGEGFPKGKSQLKPAQEPMVLARKPFVGSAKKCIEQHGTGALNIKDTRVGGRWPANVLLDERAAALLDAQSGERRSAGDYPTSYSNSGGFTNGDIGKGVQGPLYADKGGASRFFYCAKAAKKERNKGCEALYWTKDGDPLTEAEWSALPEKERRQGNIHVTVKPVALMRWLVRLVTPPGGMVLDPFMGSGSTGIAAKDGGFAFVGIELEESSYAIAKARVCAGDSVSAVTLPWAKTP